MSGSVRRASTSFLQLSGWSRVRRVVVLRRRIKEQLLAEVEAQGQQTLLFAETAKGKLWEYAVLVTNTDHPLEALGQLYRDRADCENGFDELTNQWGWGGYTTHDLERCNLSVRAWSSEMRRHGGKAGAGAERWLLWCLASSWRAACGQEVLLEGAKHSDDGAASAEIENPLPGLADELRSPGGRRTNAGRRRQRVSPIFCS